MTKSLNRFMETRSLAANCGYLLYSGSYDQLPASVSDTKKLYLQFVRLGRPARRTIRKTRPWAARQLYATRPGGTRTSILPRGRMFDPEERNTIVRILGKAGWIALLQTTSGDACVPADERKSETHERQMRIFRAPAGEVKYEPFVARARRLDEHRRTEAALDLIYDAVDQLMRDNQFERLDSMLVQTRVDDLSVDILLGILTATLPAKTRLPSRVAFFLAVEQLLKRRGDYEQGLLTGLEG